MVSRRRFLQTGSLAAGISVTLPTLAQAAEGDKSLPPAIAALRTLRGEAKPITVEERAARQEKARQLMRENNLSAILLAQGTSLAYFTGIRWEGGERLFAMVLPAKGEAFYVSPAFEEGRAREQIAQSPDGSKPNSEFRRPHLAGRREPLRPRRARTQRPRNRKRHGRRRRDGEVSLQRQPARKPHRAPRSRARLRSPPDAA